MMAENLYFKLAIALCGLASAGAILFDKSRKSYDLLAWVMVATAADYLIWDLFYYRGGFREVFSFLCVFRAFQLGATLTLWVVAAWQLWAISIAGNSIRKRRATVREAAQQNRQREVDDESTTEIPDPPDEF
jgi:hypothetical protein